ncbi:unnamed protein product [Caenorhabditis brenneri]
MKMNPFNFRKRILKQFNSARRIIASGDVAKIVNIVKIVLPEKMRKVKLEKYVGPASDMYKMVWNRQLEQAGFEYVTKNPEFGMTLHYKDYIGFVWMGDFWRIAEMALPMVPETLFREELKSWAELIETVVIIFWMVFSALPHLPLKEGAEIGAAEALYAKRFEIGCYSNIGISVCFLKKIPFQGQLFTVGGACSECEDRCETLLNEEGVYELGELCVPPKGFYAQQQTELETLESFASQSSCFLVITILTFIAVRKFI